MHVSKPLSCLTFSDADNIRNISGGIDTAPLKVTTSMEGTMVMETSFFGSKRVEAFWQDLVQDHLHGGGERCDLERLVDIGYPTDSLLHGTRHSNAKGVIEGAEVVEYAYSDSRYFRLLKKHGFPIQFAMNDFDDSTSVDNKWRATIVKRVGEIKSELLKEKASYLVGTDQYRRELGRRLFSYVRTFVGKWDGDCVEEQDDWQALEKGCGACTESSEILYFAYKYAGLNPQFLIQNDLRPTVDRIGFFQQIRGFENETHVLVGLPMSDGTILQADPLSGQYDFDFSYVHTVSPRQLAALVVENGITGREVLSLRKLQLDVAPDEPMVCFNAMQVELAALHREGKDNVEVVSEMLEEMYERYGHTPLVDYYVASTLKNSASVNPERYPTDEVDRIYLNRDAALEKLCAADPKRGAYERYMLANVIVRALGLGVAHASEVKLDNRRCQYLLNMLIESVSLDPNNPRAVGLLRLVIEKGAAEKNHDLKSVVGIYEKLLDKHPQHSYLRLLSMMASKTVFMKSGDASFIPKGYEYAKAMVVGDGKGFAHLNIMLSEFASLMNELLVSKAELGKAKALLRKDGNPELEKNMYLQMMITGVQLTDRDYLNNAIAEMSAKFPETWADIVVRSLHQTPLFKYLNSDSGDHNRAVLKKQSELLLALLDRASAGSSSRSLCDSLRVNYGLAVFAAGGGNVELVKPYLKPVEMTEELQNAIVYFLKRNVAPLAASKLKTSDGHQRGVVILNYFSDFISRSKRIELLPIFAHFDRHCIERGDLELAAETFDTMLSIDIEKGENAFYDVVIKSCYSAMIYTRSSDEDKDKAQRWALDAFNLLWINRKRLSRSMRDKLCRSYEILQETLSKRGAMKEVGVIAARATQLREEFSLEK
jgi:uncharacterized protein YqgQ